MSRIPLQKIIITSSLEIGGVTLAFFLAYSLRLMRDWIPFIQLKIQYISYEQFVPFVISGVLLWIIVGWRGGIYNERIHTPIVEQIRRVLTYSFFWFLIYIGFVYLTTGFLFSKEIPRLIIIYTYLLATIFSLGVRYIVHTVYSILYKKGYIKKGVTLVILKDNKSERIQENEYSQYQYQLQSERSTIESLIRSQKIESIILLGDLSELHFLFGLAKIYGIPLSYPQISRDIGMSTSQENWIDGILMREVRSTAITPWGRIIKRIFDIILSGVGLCILFPVFIIVGLGVWISDPTGPVVYRNRRIGQDGSLFALYKFRYMYWKYCTKEEYGIDDGSLKYEEELKKEHNTRQGPLYKIENDPRKMPWGKIIEKLSLDELPQLFNVLRGDMSLIGPRPHQPREIDQYDESDRQVLTIKPGITGMAQVYGRDKNTFKEEVALDTYYIENYSLFLDIAILMRTIGVVFLRAWKNNERK